MMKRHIFFIAFIVSLGGFLFGFDAGIISGVMSYAGPEFNLTEIQSGWVVSSPSFAAMFAMLFSGRFSDFIGRKPLLIIVALFYAISALLSAFAVTYVMLYVARIIGGLAFGAALVLAPIYIAEIATAKDRGKLVTLQQLNIVFGFFAAFLSNYFFNKYNNTDASFLSDQTVWRWMLGVEFLPAIIYFIFLFFIPKSPRWLFLNGYSEKSFKVLLKIHGKKVGQKEILSLKNGVISKKNKSKINYKDLFNNSFRFVFIVGITIGVLQQITGINAVYFYATSIFKQIGMGTDASFASGVLLSSVSVIFTFIAIYLIDSMGRRPLLLIGTAGIAISLLLCSFGFSQASYKLDQSDLSNFSFSNSNKLELITNKTYYSDVNFKKDVKRILGNQIYSKNDGEILEMATNINAKLVLAGILIFIACFAFSLGPVMWVLLSELFPLKFKGIAIGIISFINSLVSSLVQLIFPWELSTLGNAFTFFIFGIIAVFGFFILLKILPETKGKSLEEIESILVN